MSIRTTIRNADKHRFDVTIPPVGDATDFLEMFATPFEIQIASEAVPSDQITFQTPRYSCVHIAKFTVFVLLSYF